MSNAVDDRAKLHALILPGVTEVVERAGFKKPFELVLDNKGAKLVLAGMPVQIAKASEIADGSLKSDFMLRAAEAVAEALPYCEHEGVSKSEAECDCPKPGKGLTERAKRIMAEHPEWFITKI